MKLNIKDIKALIKEELTRAKILLEEPLQEAIKGNKYPFKAIFVFGPVYLAIFLILNSSSFRWSTSIMRKWCYINYFCHLNPVIMDSSYS